MPFAIVLILSFFFSCTTADNRIVGGHIVDISKFPHQLSLHCNGLMICGAALISENKALSAAHCIIRNGSYSVRGGSTYYSHGGTLIYVKNAIMHPNFSVLTNDYDLVILQLYESFSISSMIKPIKLPRQDEALPEDAMAVITGWGRTSDMAPYKPSKLHAATVPIQPMIWCKFRYGFVDLTPRMFCAGYRSGGRDACQGDSGGPLIVSNTLYGLTSWGFSCAQPGYPGVYTNIASLRDYIKMNSGV